MSTIVKKAIKKILGRFYAAFIGALEVEILEAEETLKDTDKRTAVVQKAMRWLEARKIPLPAWALNFLIEMLVAEMNAGKS